jgi:hypothetical protein
VPEPVCIVSGIAENIRAQKIIGKPGDIIDLPGVRLYFAVITSDEKMHEFIFNEVCAYIGPVMGMSLPEKRAGKPQFLGQAP